MILTFDAEWGNLRRSTVRATNLYQGSSDCNASIGVGGVHGYANSESKIHYNSSSQLKLITMKLERDRKSSEPAKAVKKEKEFIAGFPPMLHFVFF